MRVCYSLIGVLCSTSRGNVISIENVDLVENIDDFLDYPWGTVAFETAIKCIKSKTRNLFDKSTLALQGFFLSLQLIALEVILLM